MTEPKPGDTIEYWVVYYEHNVIRHHRFRRLDPERTAMGVDGRLHWALEQHDHREGVVGEWSLTGWRSRPEVSIYDGELLGGGTVFTTYPKARHALARHVIARCRMTVGDLADRLQSLGHALSLLESDIVRLSNELLEEFIVAPDGHQFSVQRALDCDTAELGVNPRER